MIQQKLVAWYRFHDYIILLIMLIVNQLNCKNALGNPGMTLTENKKHIDGADCQRNDLGLQFT
jgi:hypothetical protein